MTQMVHLVMNGSTDGTFDGVVRAGIILLAQKRAKVDGHIFLPAPDWTVESGPEALVPVKVESIEGDVIVGADKTGQKWAVWL